PPRETPDSPHSVDSPEAPRKGGAVAVLASIVALVALGLAAWAAFRPAPTPTPPAYTATQQADAKSTVCAASDLVRRGVSLNTNLAVPGGDGDVAGSLAVAANARLSLSTG